MANNDTFKSTSTSLENSYFNEKHYVLTGDTKKTDAVGNIYIHKNDPKVINKGINITDVRHAQGGYFPLLSDTNYNQRKFDNQSYNYDAKINHGSRPMHQTTFNLGYQTSHNDFLTQNNFDFRGFKLRPEYLQIPAKSQLSHQFDIGLNNEIDLKTHYGSEFYAKNNNKDYIKDFDLMPKYSVGKQVYQLQKDNKVKEYNNRKSNIKEALVLNQDEPSYWTQYKRTHDYLGHLRGQGSPKNYPDRPAYNILTGSKLEKPNWSVSSNYKKVSGNVLLNNIRQNETGSILQ